MRSSMLRDDGLGQVMLPRGYGARANVGAEMVWVDFFSHC